LFEQGDVAGGLVGPVGASGVVAKPDPVETSPLRGGDVEVFMGDAAVAGRAVPRDQSQVPVAEIVEGAALGRQVGLPGQLVPELRPFDDEFHIGVAQQQVAELHVAVAGGVQGFVAGLFEVLKRRPGDHTGSIAGREEGADCVDCSSTTA
jgi:hypothetical protein